MSSYKYIYIVEDSIIIANRIMNALRNNKAVFKVGFSNNGKAALIEISENPPDVVLLDLTLPDMSGIDVLQKVKALRLATAVVILTNNSEPIFREECKKLGADGFYDKSHQFDEAIERVNTLLK